MRELLLTKRDVEFLVGKDGEFDILVASVIHRCKRQYRDDNSAMVLVLPYMKADFRDNEESYRECFDRLRYSQGLIISRHSNKEIATWFAVQIWRSLQ